MCSQEAVQYIQTDKKSLWMFVLSSSEYTVHETVQ